MTAVIVIIPAAALVHFVLDHERWHAEFLYIYRWRLDMFGSASWCDKKLR